MKTKVFEVRDAMTFIPILATLVEPTNENEKYLLARAGIHQKDYKIIVMRLNNLEAHEVAGQWPDKTMQTIHAHLEQHFEDEAFGAVLDAEFLRGETDKPRKSERPDRIQNPCADPKLLKYSMTLVEFGEAMKEIQANTPFLEQLEKEKDNLDDEALLTKLFDHSEKTHRPEHVIQWVVNIYNKCRGTKKADIWIIAQLKKIGYKIRITRVE